MSDFMNKCAAIFVCMICCVLLANTAQAKSGSSAASAPSTAISATQNSNAFLGNTSDDSLDDNYQISIYFQNDGTFAKPNHHTDRHYTDGAALSFQYSPKWADNLVSAMPDSNWFNATGSAAGLSFGQLIFTPENTDTKALIPDDEPYAGYIYLSGFLQRANEHVFDEIQINLGLVGPSALGEQIQNGVHRMRDYKTAKGWDNQIRDEVTGQVYFRRKWRYNLGDFYFLGHHWQAQIIPQAALAVGTVHRYLEAKSLFRLGYNLPDDFGPAELGDPVAFTGKRNQFLSFYLFGSLRGRAVEHNLFLQGNTFKDNPSGFGVKPKPLTGAIQWGFALSYGTPDWSAKLIYSQTYMSKQFYDQRHTDAYGSFTVAVVGRF